MNPSRYALRVSVRVLGKEPVKGLDGEPSVTVGQITATVRQRWPFLILLARDFAAEAEAEAFLSRMRAGLWAIALEHNIAFEPYLERRSITRAEDPRKAARNLAKSFGQRVKEPIDPVHGLVEEEGYTIFRTDENIRYLAMGQVSGYVSTSWANFSATLVKGIQHAKPPTERLDQFVTVFNLYLASFYETSVRARLLTLMTCLEILAPNSRRHAAAVHAISIFRKQIAAQQAQSKDEVERTALKELAEQIGFKTETSITQRVRRLVLNEASLSEERRAVLAVKVANAYKVRSKLVHGRAVEPQQLDEAHKSVLETVKLLMRARLALAKASP